MKPNYRYNWKIKKWEQTYKFDLDFIYINPLGQSMKLPAVLYDCYKGIVNETNN